MKITIITVVLNNESTIRSAVESVLSQDYGDIEYIIMDGGSTDGTKDILAEFTDKVAVIVSEPDKGIYDAMNKGIARATGEVVGFLNADDFYPNSGVLTKVAATLHDQVDSCYGDLVYVDPKMPDKVVRYWKSGRYNPRRFYWGWMPPHPTFFVRRRVYEKYGNFVLDSGSAADYELMLRFLLRHGISTVYIPEVLVKMRMGGVSNISIRNRVKANLMDRRAWRRNGLSPYPWTLFLKPLSKIKQFLCWSNTS